MAVFLSVSTEQIVNPRQLINDEVKLKRVEGGYPETFRCSKVALQLLKCCYDCGV